MLDGEAGGLNSVAHAELTIIVNGYCFFKVLARITMLARWWSSCSATK